MVLFFYRIIRLHAVQYNLVSNQNTHEINTQQRKKTKKKRKQTNTRPILILKHNTQFSTHNILVQRICVFMCAADEDAEKAFGCFDYVIWLHTTNEFINFQGKLGEQNGRERRMLWHHFVRHRTQTRTITIHILKYSRSRSVMRRTHFFPKRVRMNIVGYFGYWSCVFSHAPSPSNALRVA